MLLAGLTALPGTAHAAGAGLATNLCSGRSGAAQSDPSLPGSAALLAAARATEARLDASRGGAETKAEFILADLPATRGWGNPAPAALAAYCAAAGETMRIATD